MIDYKKKFYNQRKENELLRKRNDELEDYNDYLVKRNNMEAYK